MRGKTERPRPAANAIPAIATAETPRFQALTIASSHALFAERSAILRSCNAAVAARARRIEKDPLMATATGTIKRLTDKGFGFIAASDGVEYFFHQSACQGTRFDDLREGQRVTFEAGQGPKGPRAENVKPA